MHRRSKALDQNRQHDLVGVEQRNSDALLIYTMLYQPTRITCAMARVVAVRRA